MRIIPAYAGSTPLGSACQVKMWDHPRVCGEHCAGWQGREDRRGSSPRMRGALDSQLRVDLVQRIIPAYAGSTCWACLGGWLSQDHPRVSGEHIQFVWNSSVSLGSSPHMRGAPVGFSS